MSALETHAEWEYFWRKLRGVGLFALALLTGCQTSAGPPPIQVTRDRSYMCQELAPDETMVDESLWEGRAPGRPFGIEGRDRPLKFRLLHVVEFTPDGQHIQREQVWVDLAAIQQQLPQE